MTKNKKLMSLFFLAKDKGVWLEFTVALTKTKKTKNPIKMNATLAWNSHLGKFAAPAAIKGSFQSEAEALACLEHAAREVGGAKETVTKADLEILRQRFGYPAGRSQYLLSEAAV